MNHDIRIPIKQPGFNGMEVRFLFSWLKLYLVMENQLAIPVVDWADDACENSCFQR